MNMNENETSSSLLGSTVHFPVGYYQLHEDALFDFEMNRWFNRAGDENMLPEMRGIAPRIRSLASWKREYLALAETALCDDETLKAAYYERAFSFAWRL